MEGTIIYPTQIIWIYHNSEQCGDVEKLTKKRKSPEDCPVYYAIIEDTYNIISKAHIATGQLLQYFVYCLLST